MAEESIAITRGLSIPLSELRFRFSSSSGPGGQNVNRVATRVELIFDVSGSEVLAPVQRERIMGALGGYVNKNGLLCLASQRTRSQERNRQEVIERFRALLRQALRPIKPRRPTRPTRASRQRRLAAKRSRAQIKRHRRPPQNEPDD